MGRITQRQNKQINKEKLQKKSVIGMQKTKNAVGKNAVSGIINRQTKYEIQ